MNSLVLEYKERFGVTGVILLEEVDALFAELDSFLDGYFLGMALTDKMMLLNPMVDKMHYLIENDEKITRIALKVTVIMKHEGVRNFETVRDAFNNAMFSFLGSRFQGCKYE